jgi:hypothetical protein
MPNEKRISFTFDPGTVLEGIVLWDETPNMIMDDVDGVFREVPADPRTDILEHLVANGFAYDIPGRFVLSESRTAWPNGNIDLIVYVFGGATPVRSLGFACEGDTLVETAPLVDASLTIRQQIMLAVYARLVNITIANGFRTNLGLNVKEWDVTPLDLDLSTLEVEYRDEAQTTEYVAVGEHLHTLPVTLRVRCQNNAAGSALTTVREAYADIYQAINRDVTFGGLAQDTNQEGQAKESYGEQADKAAAAEVVYKIEYTTEPGSP